MDPNSNPFFSDATDFTNMLLSGLLDGLNFSDEGPENGERSPIVRETLQTDLMSRGSRTGSCSDAGSPSTMCSDDDIGATIGAKWSSASQELCQEDNGGIVLERLGSNYSRSSEGQKRKPSMENDVGSPMSSPNAIHLNADIQEAIRRASITIYQGLVRHVDRFSDSKDGNIVLCVDPTGKPSQNESSVKVSEDTSVWSDAEGAGTPLLMTPQGNLELAALENEQDTESKSLNASPQRSGGTPEELSSSPCQDAFFLDKDINPELESCSDLCKSLSPALESGFAIQELGVGFDCTQEPSEQDRFSPTSTCLDAESNLSPSLLTEQNAEEKADACEAFYLQDEEDSGYKPCGDLDAVQDEQFDSSRSSPPEQQDKDETTVLILADQATDLAEDKDRLSKSPGQEQLEDIEQKVTTPKSLSPTEQHRDGTPVLMVTSEGLDCEGVNSESDIRVAESSSPLSSGPQEAPMSPALISACRDDLTEDQNGADGSLSPDQTLEAPESIPDRQAFPTATTDKDLLDQDCAEDDLVAEGGGTPSNLQRTSSQEELSRESSLSSFEEMVLHKDSGDETQQKKAPLILEEYFNAAMKKFSNTLLDALITHLDSYKDTKMGLPLPVNMKSENANFAWGQEEDETNDAKQDGEQPSMSAFMG